MPDVTLQDILVGLTRLESKVDQLASAISKQEVEIERHWKKLNEHERAIALLEQQQPPKVHPTVWLLALIGLLGFMATFVTWVIK
jgi:hypothetical protein